MKKLIAIFLTVVMCLLLVACGTVAPSSNTPNGTPSNIPSDAPSDAPSSNIPNGTPSDIPSDAPSVAPSSNIPNGTPSDIPSVAPSDSSHPSNEEGSSVIRINNENWSEYLEFVYSDIPFFTYENKQHHMRYGAYTALVLKDEYVARMDYKNAFTEEDLAQINKFEFLTGMADESKSPIYFDGTLQLGVVPILDQRTYRIDPEIPESALFPSEPHLTAVLHKCQINGKDTYAAFLWAKSKLVETGQPLSETHIYRGIPCDEFIFYGVLNLQ